MAVKLESGNLSETEKKRKKKLNVGAVVTAAVAGYGVYKALNWALPYKPIPQIGGLLFASMAYNWLANE